MICQKCKKREATRHEAVRADDGTWAEAHLCDACADAGEGPLLSQAAFMQALLEGAGSAAPRAGSARACPECGITYAEFRARGRLGCPRDYEVFLPELLPLLERIHHGGTQHVGKSPAATDARPESEKRLTELRRSLTEAIQGERYEEAARIRDRIRAEESGEPAAAAPPPKPERKGRRK
jgi:protein arginine kinase activator